MYRACTAFHVPDVCMYLVGLYNLTLPWGNFPTCMHCLKKVTLWSLSDVAGVQQQKRYPKKYQVSLKQETGVFPHYAPVVKITPELHPNSGVIIISSMWCGVIIFIWPTLVVISSSGFSVHFTIKWSDILLCNEFDLFESSSRMCLVNKIKVSCITKIF